MSYRLESFDFDYAGKTFRADVYLDDECPCAPWDISDGHGIVSGWETRSKLPGELVLDDDGGDRRFYDVQETMKKARAEKWGLSESALTKLREKLGRPATRGEIIAAAVRADFEFLRGWCNGAWHYVGVCVRALDTDGDVIGCPFDNALWGVESYNADYIREVATDLASEIE